MDKNINNHKENYICIKIEWIFNIMEKTQYLKIKTMNSIPLTKNPIMSR